MSKKQICSFVNRPRRFLSTGQPDPAGPFAWQTNGDLQTNSRLATFSEKAFLPCQAITRATDMSTTRIMTIGLAIFGFIILSEALTPRSSLHSNPSWCREQPQACFLPADFRVMAGLAGG